MKYFDKEGEILIVDTGLGKEWGTFRRSKSGGKHRVKSPAMPMVPTKEEAQKNLDIWAWKNKLDQVPEGEKSKC